MDVQEVCVQCGSKIERMPDEYVPELHNPICSPACMEREQWFKVTHCDWTMNQLTKMRFGKSQAEVPRYKGHS